MNAENSRRASRMPNVLSFVNAFGGRERDQAGVKKIFCDATGKKNRAA
jgi:hypothetical protein